MAAMGPDYGFGLYVHWPYCARICPYCDFNVYAAKDRDNGPLVDAIIADLRRHRSLLPTHGAFDSIFFGGGTPSLLPTRDLARIIEAANATFGLAPACEISIEANPNDLLDLSLADWQRAGINRLSIGVQSLADDALTWLGRDHDGDTARRAVDQAATVFENHSIDLIYARPGQSALDWEHELVAALALGAPHLSLYELTIEARTAFGKRAARGDLIPMPDDDQADLYELTQSICDAHSLPAYEVSNHARSAAYQSIHNQIYWASGDWIGIGPGAHGRITINGRRVATEATRRPQDYLEAASPTQTELSDAEAATEYLAMALRPTTGLDLQRFEAVFGTPPDAALIDTLVQNKLALDDADRLRLTVPGRLMTDHIAAQLRP